MSESIKIAIVQADIKWEDKAHNLSHYEQMLATSDLANVDLILLPEMFNTAFSMNRSLAEKQQGPTFDWLVNLAEKTDAHIGGSMLVQEGESVYNQFVIVNDNGLLVHYNKKHLFSMAKEGQFFQSGGEQVICEIKGFKLCLNVCYDLRFPVWARNRKVGGEHSYDVVVYVANWPEVRSEAWLGLLKARAIENMAYSIGVNRIGEDMNDIKYSGDSVAYDCWGKVLAETVPHQEQVMVVTLDKSSLEASRKKFPVLNDADPFELI